MALQEMHMTARFVEELIDFFMERYNTVWDPPYKLTKDFLGITKLFTPRIGKIAFSISQRYEYSKIVKESNIYQYFTDEVAFYFYVFSKAKEFLTKESGFIHMCAFSAEIAVFCQCLSHSKLHATLIAAIICLGNENDNIKSTMSRLYHEQVVRNFYCAMSERTLNENYVELTCKIPRTESNDSSAKVDGSEIFLEDNFANQMDSQLHQSQSANSGNFQISRLEPPYYSNNFSDPQFAHTSLPGYPYSNVPEAGIPMYPNHHHVQFGYPSVPIPSLNSIEQNMVSYIHPNFTSGTSMASGTTVNSKYNVNYIPPTLPSSSKFPHS